MGNPASITSTPRRASCLATAIFSSMFMEKPGACSPSLRVVSKMYTLLSDITSYLLPVIFNQIKRATIR